MSTGETDNGGWWLQVRDDEGGARRVALTGEAIVIGRSAEADVRLDRQSVSRQHARLWRDPSGAWCVSDLQSRAGTFVNLHKVDAAELRAGDVIGISRFQLVLQDGRSAAPTATGLGRGSWAEGDASEVSVLTRVTSPKVDMAQITALQAFGRELLGVASGAERLDRLCATLCGEQLRGKWAMALRLDAEDPTHAPQRLAAWPTQEARLGDVRLSRSAIRAMQESRAPVLASNFSAAAGQAVEMSIATQAPAVAVVACPLIDDEACDRLVYVSLPPMFGTTEWLALIALAVKQFQQAEAAWSAREAIEREAGVARDLANARLIQRSILPSEPAVAGLDVAWWYEPCEEIGGDYVDVIRMPDGRVALVVGDVTGHGLPAALATLAVHSVLQTCLKAGLDLPAAVTKLNDHLVRYLPDGKFVTLAAAAIDPASGELVMVNAGHHAPIAAGGPGAMREVGEPEHFPLGLEGAVFEGVTDRLEPGEWLVFSTDGVTELTLDDGQWLGQAGLMREVGAAIETGPTDAAALTEALRERWGALGQGRPSDDDVTLLVIRRGSAEG
ncbi:MAG: SpoIIE family protein phosphatase [Planctomycetota bacterium]